MDGNAVSRGAIVRLVVAVLAVCLLIAFALRSATMSTARGELAVSTEAIVDDEPTTARTAARQSGNDGDDAETVTLTLLHNNDGESKLLPDTEGGFPGIARFAETWIKLGRSSDADILLRVSAGDNILASPTLSAGLAREDGPLYDSIALRGLYEVLAFGNHDFDLGPEVTARFVEGLRTGPNAAITPFVATNLDVSGEPALADLAEAGLIVPSHIVTDPTSGHNVGVIGAITPRLANISSPGNVDVDNDIAAAVNAEVARLSKQGVDRIVLLTHLQGLTEDRDLVPLLRGVDIVVAGGGDELLRNEGDSCQPEAEPVGEYPLVLPDADGAGVLVVTTPGGYRCIGRLDVTFDTGGSVIEFDGESVGVPMDGRAEQYALTRVELPLSEALAELEATFIGVSDVALDGRRNSVRTAASNLGELLADAVLASAASDARPGQVPVVAVVNGGGIRNDAVIEAGELTLADTFEIAPFANFVAVGEVPRERFKELLDVAVAGYPDAQGGFPQISGFSVEFDPAAPGRQVDIDGDCSLVGDPGSRIRTVTLDDGAEVVKDGEVVAGPDLVMATVDFLANGGDCYPLADLAFARGTTPYQAVLAAHIAETLGGQVSEQDYPDGGSRITLSGHTADYADAIAQDGDSNAADYADAIAQDGDSDAADYADAIAQDGDSDAADYADAIAQDGAEADELPDTGLQTWLGVIIAATAAAAGAMVFAEARRAAFRSLATRLASTRTDLPD